jgi:hypothetical protein
LPKRDLVSEEELLKTHSKEMYQFLKSTLRYEIKVPVKKSELMSPNFDKYLESINKENSKFPQTHSLSVSDSYKGLGRLD